MRAAALVIVVLGAATLLAPSPAAAQTPAEVAAQARAAFERGVEEMEAGRWQPALDAFHESIELRPTQVAVLNAGKCLESLHRPREALLMYERFLRDYRADATAQRRTAAEERIRELRATMGTVLIAIDVDGAEVMVDGESVGRSPLAEALMLPAGTHAIIARLEGRPDATASTTVRPGEQSTVALNVPPAPTVAPEPPDHVVEPRTPPPSPPPPAVERSGLSPTWFWAAAGLTIAGAIGTGVLGVVVMGENSDYEESVPRTEEDRSSGRDLVHITDAVFGVTVAAAIGAVILYTQTDFGGDDPRVDVAVGPGSASVQMRGRF